MKLWKILVISLLLVLGITSETMAHAPLGEEMMVFPLYQRSSDFTRGPAQLGAWIGAVPGVVVGGAGYFVGYGVGLPFGKENQFALATALVPALSCTWLGSAIAGAPFFVVELVLIDLPNSLFKLEEETPQAIAARHWNESFSRPASKKTTRQPPPVRIQEERKAVGPPAPCIPRPTVDPETGEVRLKAGHDLQAAAGYPPNKYCDETNE
ncbi:MAG: hypothetical protein SD837_16295 [Candidatus Electrothrix scaldis]|nr:MAG: hypothetical protein SD837_16295 [Candidatus Electrothrix sp. GW3-3]